MGVTVADETQSPFSLETTEATVDSTGPFVEVVQQKHRRVLSEKKVCPLITLLGYTWVDGEMVPFFPLQREVKHN